MSAKGIQRYYVDRENVTPSHYGMGMDSRGEYVLHSDYLAAIEVLQAELNDWRESARKAAEESCGDEAHCACVGPLRVALRSAEAITLEFKKRASAAEAMLPRWVSVAQKIALDIQGWLPLDDQKCGDSERQWLMVPPIPFPEEKE